MSSVPRDQTQWAKTCPGRGVNDRGVTEALGAGGVGRREREEQFRREQRARTGKGENASSGCFRTSKGFAEPLPHLIFTWNKNT